MTTTTLRSTHPEQPAFAMPSALPRADSRTLNARRWGALIAKVLLPGGLFAISLFGALANPARAQTIDFTAAYLEIEATYLVPAGSTCRWSSFSASRARVEAPSPTSPSTA